MKTTNKLLGAMALLSAIPMKSLPQPAQHPNIIVIVADDQGYGDMSYYGNRFLKTPAMDKLAQQSARFNNFIVSPVCAPTRASLMTGRYNYRTGVWDTWKGRDMMAANEVTIAEVLRGAGYDTGLFGKWHLGYNAPGRPMDQGFDFTLEFEEYTKETGNRIDPVMRRNGVIEYHKGFLTDVVFDEATRFIEEKSKQREPFFAYIASFLPHSMDMPMVPQPYVDPFDTIPGLENHTKQVYGMVTKLDERLGMLLKRIDELGIAGNTLLVYLSDNGAQMNSDVSVEKEWRYNYGFRGSKATVYEGGIHVPCFVRWSGVIDPDWEIPQMAAHIDLLPTLAEFAHAPLPDVKIDGKSLVPLLLKKNQPWPARTIKNQFERKEVPEMWPNSTIRGERFKLVEGKELYDLWQDPGETTNVAEKYPEMTAQMKAEYEEWFEDVSSERGFVISYTIIGDKTQDEVALQFSDKNPKGWPLKVIDKGPYDIEVQTVKPELFPKGADIVLTFGDKELRKSIEKGVSTITFKNVELPLGDVHYDINTDGYKVSRIGRWNQEDLGYGNVIVRKIK